jgi:hypothetical protein
MEQSAQADRFVEIEGALGAGAASVRPRLVRLYWDRSRSRRDDDHAPSST